MATHEHAAVFEPEAAVGLALEAAREGLERGELPIGAVVFDDERILGRNAFLGRRPGELLSRADQLTSEQVHRSPVLDGNAD